jgi:glycosyl transferase, family 25
MSDSTTIPIYIINLARERRRKGFMEAQLAEYEIEATFIEAIDARTMSSTELEARSDSAAVKRSPSWLSPGAIACALSHNKAYTEFLKSDNEVALFLEDDTILSSQLSQQIQELSAEIRDGEVVLLHFVSFEPCELRKTGSKRFDGYGLFEAVKSNAPTTAAAYMLTRSTAQKFANYTSTVRATADAWGHFVENGVINRVRCTAPSIIHTAEFKSSIDYIDATSYKGKILGLIDRKRLFPFYQLLAKRRKSNVERIRDSYVLVE